MWSRGLFTAKCWDIGHVYPSLIRILKIISNTSLVVAASPTLIALTLLGILLNGTLLAYLTYRRIIWSKWFFGWRIAQREYFSSRKSPWLGLGLRIGKPSSVRDMCLGFVVEYGHLKLTLFRLDELLLSITLHTVQSVDEVPSVWEDAGYLFLVCFTCYFLGTFKESLLTNTCVQIPFFDPTACRTYARFLLTLERQYQQ